MSGGGGESALVFLIWCLFVGAIVSHFCSRRAPWLPYTPTLLVVGVLTALVEYLSGSSSTLPEVLDMWEEMDGHTLLYMFLPPLLFADCMNLQWTLIRRCLGQCLTLAGPGVILGSVLNAFIAQYVLPYGWDLTLSLSYGAVQAATDPVAVVSLLSSLGAPPSLTMVISGESLLNECASAATGGSTWL
mgnify:CR=1 FL=1